MCSLLIPSRSCYHAVFYHLFIVRVISIRISPLVRHCIEKQFSESTPSNNTRYHSERNARCIRISALGSLMTPGAFADGVPQAAEAFLALRFHTLTTAAVAAASAECVTIAIVVGASVRVILKTGAMRVSGVCGHRMSLSVSGICGHRTLRAFVSGVCTLSASLCIRALRASLSVSVSVYALRASLSMRGVCALRTSLSVCGVRAQ